MHDWQKLVRCRLSDLALDSCEKEEVHAELAAHLEELCEAFCKKGLSEREAIDRAMEQVSDWRDLQRKILIARRGDSMQNRVQQLWVPGFLTFILSTTSLAILQKLGFRPLISSWNGTLGTVLFFVPWLLSLPFLGALGAYLSARSGATRPIVLIASAFPVLALAAAFILMFPIDLIVEPIVGNHVDFGIVATAILKDGTSWLLVPGAALLLGGLFFQFLFGRPSLPQATATDQQEEHA